MAFNTKSTYLYECNDKSPLERYCQYIRDVHENYKWELHFYFSCVEFG